MSQAQQAAAELLVSRAWPTNLDLRKCDRRGVLDTRIDIDPTNAWLGEVDRRHGERRQFAKTPVAISGFGALSS